MKTIISYLSWPGLLITCMAITEGGFHAGHPIIAFNIAYAFLIANLLWLEQKMPHEEAWNESDGQFWPNIYHTLSSKGTVQGLFAFAGYWGCIRLLPR